MQYHVHKKRAIPQDRPLLYVTPKRSSLMRVRASLCRQNLSLDSDAFHVRSAGDEIENRLLPFFAERK